MNMLDVSYAARADKARNELGWQPRSPQAGMLETFNWIAEQEEPVPVPSQEEQVAKLALIAAAILLIFWLLGRRPRRKDGD
jgi:dTDP-D-glucose 4,6-dehydratase